MWREYRVQAGNAYLHQLQLTPSRERQRPGPDEGGNGILGENAHASRRINSMLHLLKQAVLRTVSATGLNSLVLNSRWRARRLLILCYHGISLDDEHEWNPALYMPAGFFRSRLEELRRQRCQVLPFTKALEALDAGMLPPRSVALTFDDGTHDFYARAYPLLREFGYPASVYLTTYYCDYNRPVFDVMCPYILWKAAGRTLHWPEVLGAAPVVLDAAGRETSDRAIKEFSRKNSLSGSEKDALLASLAERAGIDYEDLCRRRILHIMNRAEAAEMAREGIDLELHTHRHRVSRDPQRFHREIQDNDARLAALGSKGRHFCYPGGVHFPEFPEWLRKWGVQSATTCEADLATRETNRWLLPRLVDTSLMPAPEFASWLSGFRSMLPRRHSPMSEGQLLEEAG